MRSIRRHVRLLLWCALLPWWSCKESLPEYRDPRDVFDGTLSSEYVYRANDNSLKVDLTVKNAFDETFQAKAVLGGTVEIVLRRDPTIRKTFNLSAANLIQARGYNPATQVLTFDPGDSIRFRVSWNFIDDKGRDLRQDVFLYHVDRTCPLYRRFAREEAFTITGSVRLYEKTEVVKPRQIIFFMCHINVWVDARVCPSVTAEDACRLY